MNLNLFVESKRKHVINIYIFVLVFGMESIWFVWVYCFHWYCANCENLSLSNYRLFHKTVPFLAELQFEYQTVSIVTLLVKCSRITTPNIYSPYICLFTIYMYTKSIISPSSKISSFLIVCRFQLWNMLFNKTAGTEVLSLWAVADSIGLTPPWKLE